MIRLAYHASLLTGAGWVMELLAGHPMGIHTELGVTCETFIALIEASWHGSHQLPICFSRRTADYFLYASVTELTVQHLDERFQRFNDTISKYQNIGAENYLGILKKWLLYFPHPHLHQPCPATHWH